VVGGGAAEVVAGSVGSSGTGRPGDVEPPRTGAASGVP
jgi:hypothetical protein